MFSKSDIQKQVEKVIQFSQEIDTDVDATELIDSWLAAKGKIIDAFHGELIIESPEPITFHLSAEEREAKLKEFASKLSYNWNNEILSDFIMKNKDGFYDNTVVRGFEAPDGTIITKGSKILKALKHFNLSEAVLKHIQSEASMIIQEDKIEGILCLSVHPLDYLSSSENTYRWRSCHALDGEYRAGNLSYMLDSSTIVCYLRSKNKEEYLPRFPDSVPWNSKKWRMLLFLSDDWHSMFAGRQYPFTSASGMNQVAEILDPLLKETIEASYDKDWLPFGYCYGWSNWYNERFYKVERLDGSEEYFNPTICMSNHLYEMKKLITDVEGSLHFDDLLHSSCYVPYYRYLYNMSWIGDTDNQHFTIGHTVPCVVCGSHVKHSETMMCPSCDSSWGHGDDEYQVCECCGDHIYDGDDYFYGASGELICAHCVDRYYHYCERCGELIYEDDVMYIEEKAYCNGCYEKVKGSDR